MRPAAECRWRSVSALGSIPSPALQKGDRERAGRATPGPDSHDEQGEPCGVRAQGCEQLEVTAIAGDDLHVVAPATGVCLSGDDGIDTRWRRIESGADR